MSLCAWCSKFLTSSRAKYCGVRCRQTAFRLRRRRATEEKWAQPARFAYADPPYPKLSSKYYRHEPDFAGEVDHPRLIASLMAGNYDGWALSTSSEALRYVLGLCPRGAKVCPWIKPGEPPSTSSGRHNMWEPVIVVGGRERRAPVKDYLYAQPARGGAQLDRAKLMGRKPLAFCAWLFDLLGMQAEDSFDDLFPGSGVVSVAWASLGAATDPSSGAAGHG